MMRTRLVSCGSAAMLAAFACAARSVSHNAPDESRPHVTWDIRAGGDEGDDHIVCTSTSPPRACVLSATAEGRPSRATVHLYLHPAARQTNYLGTMKLTFMQGSSVLRAHEVSGSVKPGSQPQAATVHGLVTSEPGSYELSVALDAIQEGTTTPQRIVETAPVTVK